MNHFGNIIMQGRGKFEQTQAAAKQLYYGNIEQHKHPYI